MHLMSELLGFYFTYNSKKFFTGKSRVITAQKMRFSIKGFFSKCDQICRKLRIWSHLLKKSLMENFIFCVVNFAKYKKNTTPKPATSPILSFLNYNVNTYLFLWLLKNIPFTSPSLNCLNLKHDFDSISLIPKTIPYLVSRAICNMRQYALSVQNTQASRYTFKSENLCLRIARRKCYNCS